MDPNTLLAHFSEQQVAAFFLVLARVSPLFILVDGWNLVCGSLVQSFHS